jgi:hypothetical protein
LEALLKRVDGLEAKLKEKNAGEKTPTTPTLPSVSDEASSSTATDPVPDSEPNAKSLAVDTSQLPELGETAVYSPTPIR